MKTTNAKTKVLQTPAPFGGTLKPQTNRRTSTAQRIKKAASVAQPAQTKVYNETVEDDVPDIEYMPPKPTGMTQPAEYQFYKKTDDLQTFQTYRMKLLMILHSLNSSRRTEPGAWKASMEGRKSALMASLRNSASSKRSLSKPIRWPMR